MSLLKIPTKRKITQINLETPYQKRDVSRGLWLPFFHIFSQCLCFYYYLSKSVPCQKKVKKHIFKGRWWSQKCIFTKRNYWNIHTYSGDWLDSLTNWIHKKFLIYLNPFQKHEKLVLLQTKLKVVEQNLSLIHYQTWQFETR